MGRGIHKSRGIDSPYGDYERGKFWLRGFFYNLSKQKGDRVHYEDTSEKARTKRKTTMNKITSLIAAFSLLGATSAAIAAPTFQDMKDDMKMDSMMMATTGMFKGIEVNKGSATISHSAKGWMVKLSPDFVIPKTPAPHIQIVDKAGNVYLLNQLKVAGNKTHRDAMIPGYIKSVASVRIRCSFAEVNLGEAKLAKAIDLN